MKSYKAELFSEEKYQLGESPFYDSVNERLSWVDITEGKVFSLDKLNNKKIFKFNQPVGAAVPAVQNGSYVLAAMDGLYLLGEDFTSPLLIKNLSEYYKNYHRSNDAKADPAGRLWFGSCVNDDHPAEGNLFSMEPPVSLKNISGIKINCRQKETKISNGMAWNKAHTKFFFSDSLEHSVFSYDYDEKSGQISNRQILFTVTDSVPDGMTIDSNDNLWVALWGGKRIEERSSKDGSLISTVYVDAEHVSSCTFYGKNLDTLFITSSAIGLDGKYDGCLFTCKVEAQGLPCDKCNISI